MRNFLMVKSSYIPSGVMVGTVVKKSNLIQTSHNPVGLGAEPIMDQVPINWNGIIARIVGVPGESPSNSKWISFVVEKFHHVLHFFSQLESHGYQGPAGWCLFTCHSKWNFGLIKSRGKMVR